MAGYPVINRRRALRALTRHWSPRSAALWLEDLRRGVERDAITATDAAALLSAAAAGHPPQVDARRVLVEVTPTEADALSEFLPTLHLSSTGALVYDDLVATVALPGGRTVAASDTLEPDTFELLTVVAECPVLTDPAPATAAELLPQLEQWPEPGAAPTWTAPDPVLPVRRAVATLTAAPAAPPAPALAAA
jgi:hypothetical protein